MSKVRRLRDERAAREASTPGPTVSFTSTLSERALIGALIDAESRHTSGMPKLDVVAEVHGDALTEAFSDPTLRDIWRLLCERHRRGEPKDLISIADALRAQNLHLGAEPVRASDIVGWIAELVEAIPCGLPSLARRYASEIREAAFRRDRTMAAEGLIEALRSERRPLREWYRDAAAPLSVSPEEPVTETRVSEELVGLMADVEDLVESGRTIVPGIPTGLADLDQHTGGLRRGELIVVAGRTGMGKTAFSLTVTRNATERGVSVGYISCEMGARALLQRLLAQISGIEVSRLWRGPLGPQHHATLTRAAAQLAALPLHIVDLVRDWPLVAEECRRLVHRGVRLLAIDYLGLLTISGARVDRWEMVGMITAEAKQLALTLDVPVMLLCQLNRESTREAQKRPALWHLRDSGCVEQDADLVLLLHREGAYERSPARSDVAEINVAKFRNGPTGPVIVRWRAELAQFEDRYADESEDGRYP